MLREEVLKGAPILRAETEFGEVTLLGIFGILFSSFSSKHKWNQHLSEPKLLHFMFFSFVESVMNFEGEMQWSLEIVYI